MSSVAEKILKLKRDKQIPLLVDAVVEYIQLHNLDIDEIAQELKEDIPFKEMLYNEALKNNLLKEKKTKEKDLRDIFKI